jgi:hypothetical protein
MDHMRKTNLRVISFLLTLIFTQKLVLGLWLHNWLHERRNNHSSVCVGRGGACVELQLVKCSCIDDALMPLIQSRPFDFQGHRLYLITLLTSVYSAAVTRGIMIPALRGPPFAPGLL